jgi:hypothetical protein
MHRYVHTFTHTQMYEYMCVYPPRKDTSLPQDAVTHIKYSFFFKQTRSCHYICAYAAINIHQLQQFCETVHGKFMNTLGHLSTHAHRNDIKELTIFAAQNVVCFGSVQHSIATLRQGEMAHVVYAGMCAHRTQTHTCEKLPFCYQKNEKHQQGKRTETCERCFCVQL